MIQISITEKIILFHNRLTDFVSTIKLKFANKRMKSQKHMPKKVLNQFIGQLQNDVSTHYKEGDRYLSIRQISEHFHVSIQTAQRGVAVLTDKEILLPKKKAGIKVGPGINHLAKPLLGKRIIVLSKVSTPIFYQGFLDGIKERVKDSGAQVDMIVHTEKQDVSSLSFGQWMVDQHAAGFITLSYTKESALPFYHALREGTNIVSDIILDDLPILPAVQTDNYRHAFAAGRYMANLDLDSLYVFGTYPEKNKRMLGFAQGVKESGKTVEYEQLAGIDLMVNSMNILSAITPKTGIFLSDYTSVHNIASLCSRFHIHFKEGTIIAYDGAESNEIRYPGIPPIPCIGPTFKELGYNLCDTLVQKILTGNYPQPLQKRI